MHPGFLPLSDFIVSHILLGSELISASDRNSFQRSSLPFRISIWTSLHASTHSTLLSAMLRLSLFRFLIASRISLVSHCLPLEVAFTLPMDDAADSKMILFKWVALASKDLFGGFSEEEWSMFNQYSL